MFLKNYTSGVPVLETISKIEKTLIKCGVSGIMKEYGPAQEVTALVFKIPGPSGDIAIRLPVDEKKATEALWLDYVDGDKLSADGQSISAWGNRKTKRRSDFVEQGRRTAWKIMQDWVEVQMSMIQLKQAGTLEVFLPYIWDGSVSVYQRVMSGGLPGLLPEKT